MKKFIYKSQCFVIKKKKIWSFYNIFFKKNIIKKNKK